MQDIVVGNKTLTDVAKPSEIVQLLLNDEQLASLDSSATSNLSDGMGSTTADNGAVRDLWNEDGDDFFGHSTTAISIVPVDNAEEDSTLVPASTRGKKRKTTRPRKSNVRKRAAQDALSPTLS